MMMPHGNAMWHHHFMSNTYATRLVGAEVRSARLDAGYTSIEAFATAAGLSARVIGDLETGRRDRFTDETIAAVERVLDWAPGRYQELTTSAEASIVAGYTAPVGAVTLPDPRELGAAYRTSEAEASGFAEVTRLGTPWIEHITNDTIAFHLTIPDCEIDWQNHFIRLLGRYTFGYHMEYAGETMINFNVTVAQQDFETAIDVFDNCLEEANDWYRTVHLPEMLYTERWRALFEAQSNHPTTDPQARNAFIGIRARAMSYRRTGAPRYIPDHYLAADQDRS